MLHPAINSTEQKQILMGVFVSRENDEFFKLKHLHMHTYALHKQLYIS